MVSRVLLRDQSWFEGLGPELRDWLSAKMEPVTLEAGQTLFEAGAVSDCLYLVTRGALGAFSPDDDTLLVGQVVAGETVGELGLVTRQPRSAWVRALRDTALLRLSPQGFDALCREHPEAVLSLARVVLERARRPIHQRLSARPRTIALLPQTEGLMLEPLAEWCARALGGAAIVRRRDEPGDDALERLEREQPFVLYVAEPGDDAWRKRCLRQADALLFVATAHEPVAPWAELERGVQAPLPRPEHVVLLHAGDVPPGSSSAWKGRRPRAQLHHCRGQKDVGRICRLVTGTARGVVLSGGGARGFAHLGCCARSRKPASPSTWWAAQASAPSSARATRPAGR